MTARTGATIGFVLSALLLWGSSRMMWLTVHASDDKSGDVTRFLNGNAWASALVPVAVVLLAAAAAAVVVGKMGRRITGAVAALVALATSWLPVHMLTSTPDKERARTLLTHGVPTGQGQAAQRISDWATITSVEPNHSGAALALVACAVALIAGVVLVGKPGDKKPDQARYEPASVRREQAKDDLAEAPESSRVMWDALDADIDPTDDSHHER